MKRNCLLPRCRLNRCCLTPELFAKYKSPEKAFSLIKKALSRSPHSVKRNTNYLLDILTQLDTERAEKQGLKDFEKEDFQEINR